MRLFYNLTLLSYTPNLSTKRLDLKRFNLCRARVGGVDIPNNKKIEFSLQYIYGIGRTTAKKILFDSGVNDKRTFDLKEEELQKLRDEVDKYTTEGDLRRFDSLNVKRLKDISCYRG